MPINADLGHLGHDPELAMKIMRKRQEEMARRTKLQDPRRRQFGVDHSVLDAQVVEKREIAAAEEADHAGYADIAKAQDELLNVFETIKEQNRRAKQTEVVNFSTTYLRKEQRREWPLSDPKEYTSSFITHPPEQLGPCSMIKFQGEAIDLEGRRRQKAETAAYLKKQMQEKCDREQAEKDLDRFYAQKTFEANHVAAHCEAATWQEMKAEKEEESRTNLELAAQKRDFKMAKAQKEAFERSLHVEVVATSGLLTEAHDYKVGSNGKLQKGEYKRLSIEEEALVYNTNAHLYMQKKMQERLGAEEAKKHHATTLQVVTVMGAVEEQQSRIAKEREVNLAEENRKLAEARRGNKAEERRKYLSHTYEP